MDMPCNSWSIPPDSLFCPLLVSGRRARVLVVENDPIIALDVALMVEDLGGEVIDKASSGPVAIAQADRLRPDVVLMDVGLDGPTDGIQTAEMIRSRWAIPVVFATGSSDDETIRRIAAFNGPRVPKPVCPMALRQAISSSLRSAAQEYVESR